MTSHQIHPKTGKIVRQVKVIKVEGEVATVKALNGPMRGSIYEIPTKVVKG